ncbi:MAG: hypothetical protein ACRD3Q_14290 [Terriglobales bacterium]
MAFQPHDQRFGTTYPLIEFRGIGRRCARKCGDVCQQLCAIGVFRSCIRKIQAEIDVIQRSLGSGHCNEVSSGARSRRLRVQRIGGEQRDHANRARKGGTKKSAHGTSGGGDGASMPQCRRTRLPALNGFTPA